MELFKNEKECCGCGACYNICPKQAITMKRNDEGFDYPEINNTICINCGLCEKVCPIKHKQNKIPENKYFGFKKKENRETSSSGGAFQEIAKYIFDKKGIVFAAGFDKDMKVKHLEITKREDLYKVQRTKYVQSDTNESFKKAKEYLDNNKYVLFVGTPCQIHGLKLFLNKDYENLITVDLVCFGVPSPGIWEQYVKYIERKHDGKLIFYDFRDKRAHDSGHTVSYKIAIPKKRELIYESPTSIAIRIENNIMPKGYNIKEYSRNLYKDPYCSIFFKRYMIRPSCHECKYTTVNRISDFTIGDFWGIEKVKPEFDDKMGVSLIIAHTDKAKDIINKFNEENIFECKKENILQPRLISPTEPNDREKFMNDYKNKPFGLLLFLYSKLKK